MKNIWLVVAFVVCIAANVVAAADYSVSAGGLNWGNVSGVHGEFRVRPRKTVVWGISVDQMNVPVRLKEECLEIKNTDISLTMGWWINQKSKKKFGSHFFFGGGATFMEAGAKKYRFVSTTNAHFKLGLGFDWYVWRSESKSLAFTLSVIGVGPGPRVVLLSDPFAKEQKSYGSASALEFGLSYWF